MLKKAVQQGRSERRPEAYPLGYVEDLNDARTKLAGFFSILTGRLFVGIDNLWRALGKRTTFRRGAVRGPYVEDHGDQTDHD